MVISHNEYQKTRYRKFKDRYYKYVHCSMCGAQPIVYHHVNGDKEANVSQLWSYKAETIRKEFLKCIPLCAGCHMIAHSMKTKEEVKKKYGFK